MPALVVPTQQEECGGVVDLERPEVENALRGEKAREKCEKGQRRVLIILFKYIQCSPHTGFPHHCHQELFEGELLSCSFKGFKVWTLLCKVPGTDFWFNFTLYKKQKQYLC